MTPTWNRFKTSWPLAQRNTNVCKRRLMAVATSSAFFFSGWAPNASAIEPDWSIKNKKQDGLVLLISAEYGMIRSISLQKRGQAPFVRSALQAVPAKGARPLF